MATFKVNDPNSGQTLTLEGDSPPTEEELNNIFDLQQRQSSLSESATERGISLERNPIVEKGDFNFMPELSDLGEKTLGDLERVVEPLTPAGLLNQPSRLLRAAGLNPWSDPFKADTPIIKEVPKPKGTGVVAGLGRIGANVVNALQTPEAVVTLPLIGAAPVRALIAGQMASSLPEQVENAIDVSKSPESTAADVTEAVGMPVVTGAMTTALVKGKSPKVKKPEVAAEVPKSDLSRYQELMAQLKEKSLDEAAPIIKEIEAIKNKTGGMPPKPEAPRPSESLNDIYKIFEPAPKVEKTGKSRLSGAVEAIRTGFSSKFRPIDKLAEDIAKTYGTPSKKGIAGIFEQLKGSLGKGEADVYRFDQDVAKLVQGSERDFNAYMFLRRGVDRLTQDAKDIQSAIAGEEIPNLNRRKISQYTIPQLESKLNLLKDTIGAEKTTAFEKAADAYQVHMDNALKLQVESGRMSQEVYDAIKKGNQFYAPFKVMKYIEEASRPEGTGKRIDTPAEFTKAMEGIEDADFRLGDMLGAARQSLLLSRILADKNNAMRRIADLASFDTQKAFIQKLKSGEDAPAGKEPVNIFEGGKQERYAVNPDIAQAVQLYGGNAGSIISQVLQTAAVPFRAGATALNVPFQVSNLMADLPRQALVSKYGLRGVTDLVRYPLELVESFYTSMLGNVAGVKNKLYLDFLDSGAAGSTIQEGLTPKALRFDPISKPKQIGKRVLYALPDFAQAIEQTGKILGVKKAMRIEGVTSGAELAKKIPEAVTEIRRFSGSPDFGRQGKWVEQARLNLLYMFLNARIQGATADIGRLAGRDGKATAAKTWFKVGTAVGIPTAYLYLLNHDEEYAADYDKRTAQEKQNYWLIPKDSFITTEEGEKVRDYWRIPKRESAKWIANMVESGLAFGEKRDPQTFAKWGQSMIEDISPVNIQGNTAQERMESVGSSLNPILKAPLETATGRDMYRHRDIIPDSQKKASPELQYTDRTAEVFKTLANAMPDIAPEVMRSPLMIENMTKNLTAGLITQFLPRKPVEGRSNIENTPLLQRFQGLPFADQTKFKDEISKLERAAADEQLTRHRNALEVLKADKGKPIETIVGDAVKKYGEDEKLIRHIADLWIANERGATQQDRQLLALPTKQRAEYIAEKLKSATPAQKQELIREFGQKRILTEAVGEELVPLLNNATQKP